MLHGDLMEKFVEKSYLYDYYGELLTKRQQQIYEEVVFEDYTLSEAASEENVSRQGIHDMIKRCDKALEEYENKLHLVERFLKIKASAERIKKMAEALGADEICKEADEIIEDL